MVYVLGLKLCCFFSSKLRCVCSRQAKLSHFTMSGALDAVPNVEIDIGRFKYILVKVYDGENEENFKYVVRGSSSASYHADIYDSLCPKINKLGLECECEGGGRILHNPEEKTIHVFGYSQGYGQADHSISVKLLKEHYPDYTKIDFSNEGY